MSRTRVPNVELLSDTARANLLTNGGFEIWQRGNGPFTASGAWAADRWQIALSGADTLSVQADGANVDIGIARAAACTATKSGGTNTLLHQDIKIADFGQFRGRVLSLSVRVRTTTASAVRIHLNTDVDAAVPSSYHTGGG